MEFATAFAYRVTVELKQFHPLPGAAVTAAALLDQLSLELTGETKHGGPVTSHQSAPATIRTDVAVVS